MKNRLREAIENRKAFIIKQLILRGIYKKDDKQLYELTLSELEIEYKYLMKQKHDKI